MPVTIGAKPQNDFTNPIGVLTDCHRRIEHFLSVIRAVSDARRGGALSEEERTALNTALGYFQKSAPKHTDDEEDSLFPALRRSSEESASAVNSLERLHQQHLSLELDHDQVDLLCRRWLDRGELDPADYASLGEAVDRLSNVYSEHISAEESEIFPLAASVLSRQMLLEIGREMASRRGIDLPIPDEAP